MIHVYALENPRLQYPVLRWLDFNRKFAAFHETMSVNRSARLPLIASSLEALAEQLVHHSHVRGDITFSLPNPEAVPTGFCSAELDEQEQKQFLAELVRIRKRRNDAGLE